MAALLLMPTMARWTMVYAIFAYPYAREQGMGKIFQEGTNLALAGYRNGDHTGCSLGLMRLDGLAVMAAAMLIALLVANWLSRKLGGLTGDTYGAINEIGRGVSPDSNTSDNLELRRMSMTFILGGARSGKSRFAQELAAKLGKRVLFVATCEATRRGDERAHRGAQEVAALHLENSGDTDRCCQGHERQNRRCRGRHHRLHDASGLQSHGNRGHRCRNIWRRR